MRTRDILHSRNRCWQTMVISVFHRNNPMSACDTIIDCRPGIQYTMQTTVALKSDLPSIRLHLIWSNDTQAITCHLHTLSVAHSHISTMRNSFSFGSHGIGHIFLPWIENPITINSIKNGKFIKTVWETRLSLQRLFCEMRCSGVWCNIGTVSPGCCSYWDKKTTTTIERTHMSLVYKLQIIHIMWSMHCCNLWTVRASAPIAACNGQ